MKRAITVGFVAILLGTSVGVGSSFLRYGGNQNVYRFSKPNVDGTRPTVASGPKPVSELRPRLVLDGDDTHDFGIMSRNERRSHTFYVKNEGTADLTVVFVDKSCQCTEVSLTRTDIPPGHNTEITLTWQPSSFDEHFHQTARFKTNDPARLELDLSVEGKVQQVVQAKPRAVSFDSVSVGDERTVSFNVFGYRDADLQIESIEFLNPETASYFEAMSEPLSAQELKEETGALVGYRVSVKLLPGLSLGRFYQRLRLNLNLPDVGPLDIPLAGSIVGQITMAGRGYSSHDGVWRLGSRSAEATTAENLFILVKGEQAASIEMKIKSVDPDDVMKAEIVPPPAGSKLAKYQLKLTFVPQHNVVNRLGNQQGDLAEIRIETNHPDIPEIRIPVSFLLESPL